MTAIMPVGEPSLPTLPDFAAIEAAVGRIAGQAIVTPLLRNHDLDRRTGGRILLKPETLQRTGSFKFRGAYNKIRALCEAPAPPRAIVAYSSGNHAQGVAAAAQLAGLSAAIVMPADAPAIKVANTRSYGAEVIFYDRYRQDRMAVAAQAAAERNAALVPPYDDPDVIAGQGTLGHEIARQAAALGFSADVVLSPCGGGGLVGGTALALATLSPATRVYAVEPAGFDDTARSLAAHRRLGNAPEAKSICDALLVDMPGRLTFALNDRLLAGGLAVSDDEVLAAMAYGFRVLKLVIEPGGAVALAAALSGKIDLTERSAVIVLSGGNVDPASFGRALERARD